MGPSGKGQTPAKLLEFREFGHLRTKDGPRMTDRLRIFRILISIFLRQLAMKFCFDEVHSSKPGWRDARMNERGAA